jgi:CheY-like chemotaxis protein
MIVEIPNGDVALRSVLILEDEALVSMMMEDVVRELGVENVHVVADAATAKHLAATADLDCAVLDVRVRDGDSSEVADILLLRGIPFVFSTGSGVDSLPERHRHLPLLTKPFADDELRLLLLDTVAATRAKGARAPAALSSAEGWRTGVVADRDAELT